jgi:hypothetical protein
LGNWISVYTDEPRRLATIPGSRDTLALREILAAQPGSEEEQAYLTRLVEGKYECEESDEGGRLLYAFQKICETYSPAKTTVEVYLDEELFPEMWQFAHGARDTPAKLPASSWGSPSVGFWPNFELRNFQQVLGSLDFRELENTTLHPGGYREEIREILDVLKAAGRLGVGVYVFINE